MFPFVIYNNQTETYNNPVRIRAPEEGAGIDKEVCMERSRA